MLVVLVVAIAAVVVVALFALMRWADKRDRANGHVNRRMGDVRTTIREQRTNLRTLRRPAGDHGAHSPHQVGRDRDQRR